MKNLNRPLLLSLTALLAGCGGGGGSSPIPNGNPNVNPTPAATATAAPNGNATPTPSGSPTSVNTAQLTLSAPPRTAGAGPLAPVTSIVAVLQSINGNTQIPGGISPTTVIPVTNASCSFPASGEVCSIAIPAPAGSIAAVITEYAGSSYVATGSITFTSTGAAGQTQTLALGAIVGNAAITAPNLTVSQASVQPLTIVVTDPSGAVISGSTPFATPLTITDSDTSGVTQLEVGTNASTLGTSVPYNNPTTVINVVYNGGGFGQIAINANGSPAQIASPQGFAQAPYRGK